MLLQGVFPAITTPFYPDGSVYHRKLEHNVDRYSLTPVAGLVVLGSTGEAVFLSENDQREVLRTARAFAAPEKVLIAGVGQESAVETLRMAEHAASLGYDLALVRTPHYYRPQMQPANQLAFYRFVADRSPLPVLLYSVPPFTAYDLPLDAIVELAEHPNIVGIKESGGDVEKIRRIVERTAHVRRTVNVTEVFNAVTGRMTEVSGAAPGDLVPAEALAGTAVAAPARPKFKLRTREVGFQVLGGSAQKMHASLDAGAGGMVLAFAACAPTACYEIYTAWKENDQPLAAEKQARIAAAATRVAAQLGIPGVKHACDLNGYYGGPCRLPLLPLTGAEKDEVARLMDDIRH